METFYAIIAVVLLAYARSALGFSNYLFDCYLYTIVRIFLLFCLTVLLILLLINIINGQNESGRVKGLDRLSFLNVGPLYTD
jgi:hypothetical protein